MQDILLIDKDQIKVNKALNPAPMLSKSRPSELKIGFRHTKPQNPSELQYAFPPKLNSFERAGRAY